MGDETRRAAASPGATHQDSYIAIMWVRNEVFISSSHRTSSRSFLAYDGTTRGEREPECLDNLYLVKKDPTDTILRLPVV